MDDYRFGECHSAGVWIASIGFAGGRGALPSHASLGPPQFSQNRQVITFPLLSGGEVKDFADLARCCGRGGQSAADDPAGLSSYHHGRFRRQVKPQVASRVANWMCRAEANLY